MTTIVKKRHDGSKRGITPASSEFEPWPSGQLSWRPARLGFLLSHVRGRGRPRPTASQE